MELTEFSYISKVGMWRHNWWTREYSYSSYKFGWWSTCCTNRQVELLNLVCYWLERYLVVCFLCLVLCHLSIGQSYYHRLYYCFTFPIFFYICLSVSLCECTRYTLGSCSSGILLPFFNVIFLTLIPKCLFLKNSCYDLYTWSSLIPCWFGSLLTFRFHILQVHSSCKECETSQECHRMWMYRYLWRSQDLLLCYA